LKYDYLDDVHTRKDKQMLKEKNKSSVGDWPDLEYALFEWYLCSYVECYSVDQPGKQEESSDEEEEVKQIEGVETLRIIERLKLWKLQRGTDQDIKALDRIQREIVRLRSSTAHQTTILRFFELK
jgi:hypothetical protein